MWNIYIYFDVFIVIDSVCVVACKQNLNYMKTMSIIVCMILIDMYGAQMSIKYIALVKDNNWWFLKWGKKQETQVHLKIKQNKK